MKIIGSGPFLSLKRQVEVRSSLRHTMVSCNLLEPSTENRIMGQC